MLTDEEIDTFANIARYINEVVEDPQPEDTILTDAEIDLVATLNRYINAVVDIEIRQALSGDYSKSRCTWVDLERIVKGQPLEGWDEYVATIP
ncbi:MAG: hypothetical protein MSC45_05370 [Mobiluncus sp.]|uniref:Uncharacterized protein n=1 Tax=Mobiluncus porci TaxID=2652278 RepID=A0A7K0K1Y7_9ACTO|nr:MULTISPECIES: hypothetical protein [Mobiluncus]MCI6584481.1 hypothetical protein [Mobiluncus sp.]MST49506.1 hypothetical protein [Mobiluncus porci]